MFEHLHAMPSAEGFMPHGMCYLWQPGILALHVVSDSFIALAYASIPFTLLYFVRRRRDLQFNWMFVCFAIFIIACGTTHVMEIVTIWNPMYWLSGTVKAITAAASVPTAFLLVKLIPDALRLPSPAALQRQIEISEQHQQEVRRANEALEARVAERTAQLEAANRKLQEEIRQRVHAEETTRSSRKLLEAIVDNTGAIIFAKDLDGRYLVTNRRFDECFGLKRSEIVGRTDADLLPVEVADRIRAVDRRVASGTVAITEEERMPLADGEHVFVSLKAPLLDDGGKAYAMFGVSTDITERKRAELHQQTQLAKMEQLESTTNAIVELRDPLAIYSVVLKDVEGALGVDLACICKREAEGHLLTIGSVGPGSQPVADELALEVGGRIAVYEDGLDGYVAGKFVYEPDISGATSRFPERLARVGLRSLVIAPLMVEQKLVGVLMCARREAAGFSTGDCEFLRRLSDRVSRAAHQAHLFTSLKRNYEELLRKHGEAN